MDELTADDLWDLVIENDREIAALDPTDYAGRFRRKQLAQTDKQAPVRLIHQQSLCRISLTEKLLVPVLFSEPESQHEGIALPRLR